MKVDLDMKPRHLGEIKLVLCPHEWISVSNKLPRDKEWVLIWDKNCHVSYDGSQETIVHIYTARFYQGEHRPNGAWRSCDTGFGNNEFPWNWESGARSWFSQDITHWMPLPSPPEISNEGRKK